MLNRYLVCYDVCDPKRLRKVFKVMKGFGEHLQLSVFACDLSKVQRVRMIRKLTGEINEREDSVVIVDLGPTEGRGSQCFEHLGRSMLLDPQRAVIV